jgi:hypothetical protein
VVSAGADQTITVRDPAFLRATVSDDGLPGGLGDLRWSWSQVSGPAPVVFDQSRDLFGVARFSMPGSYTLRLTANDRSLTAQDDVVINVVAAAATVLRVPQDYATIQAAVDAAPARALVLVSPGTYTETVTISKTLTLASTYYTTGDESLVDRTVIQAPSAAAETILISKTAGPETQVVGFKISGGGRNGIKSSGSAKVIANHVTGIATDGVEFTSEAAVGLVERNVIEDNLDDGIDVNFSQLVVSNNVVRGNRGDGVEYRLRNRPSAVGTVVFRANDVSANRHDGIQIIDQDTTAPTATKVVLDRNVLATNGQAAIGLLDAGESNEDYRAASLLERMVVTNNTVVANAYGITGGDNMTVANNVFANNTNTALKRVDGASLATYNLFWANGLASDGSNVDGAHNVNANPLLDSTYHLQSGSPAIDAGIAALTLANGEEVVDIPPAQYNGSAPDLGRYETGGSAANAAPVVSAGPDQSIVFPATATLTGSVSDDGRPNPPGTTTKQWTQVAGPPGVTFGSPGSTTTTATFPTAGVYTLRLTANDSALTSSDDVVITVVSGGGSGGTVDVRIAAGPGDAEEAASGSVALGSADLQLVYDGSNQTVGLRFTGVGVPQGATVTRAYVQFQVDEVNSEATALTIRGQAADNAPRFASLSGNISARPRTGAAISWSPPPWSSVGAAGTDQRTSDLTPIVSEIVARPGWISGNALVLIVTGTGHRTAEAYNGVPAAAPLLHVEYTSG